MSDVRDVLAADDRKMVEIRIEGYPPFCLPEEQLEGGIRFEDLEGGRWKAVSPFGLRNVIAMSDELRAAGELWVGLVRQLVESHGDRAVVLDGLDTLGDEQLRMVMFAGIVMVAGEIVERSDGGDTPIDELIEALATQPAL